MIFNINLPNTNGDNDYESETCNNKLQAFPGNIDYMDPDDPHDQFSVYIKKRKDIDTNGIYDVIAHGDPKSIFVNLNGKKYRVDHRLFAKILKHNDNYNNGPIRLFCCNTGSSNHGFAQNLANKMNVIVTAPNKLVWAFPNGAYFVADRSQINAEQPDPHKKGEFVKFYPGGSPEKRGITE